MKRLYLFFSIIILCQCCRVSDAELHSKTKPNIVFLFADDMTYSAIHALGNDEIHTPNLDRLVKGGTTFTNAYNMGGWNGAICVASRAMIISGRYLWRANEFRQNWVNKDSAAFKKSWGKLMEGAGYETYMTGKWHVDAPAGKVFQHVKHIRPGMPPDAWHHHEMMRLLNEAEGEEKVDGQVVSVDNVMPVGYNRPKDENDDSWSPTDPKYGGFWEGGKHWSEVLKDDALEFIEKSNNSEHPFFMYLAFNAPHDPRQAPAEFMDMYSLDDISLPVSWQPEYPEKELIGNGRNLRDEALAPFPRTEYATKVHIKEYYAIISHLDAQIGKILDALEATGKMGDTYVFFSADHGLAVGKHGLLGKQNQYDHSIRPPLMVMGPEIPAGRTVRNDIYLQDIMATTLEIAGVEKPDYVEFKSFLSQAKGETEEGNYSEIYGAYVQSQRMIRKDGYKLIVYPKAQKLLLFDMKEDPHEVINLAEDDNQQKRVREMMASLKELQEKMGDPLELNI